MRFPAFLLIGGALLLSSCFGLFDNGTDPIIGEYEASWIDRRDSRAIYSLEEQIPAYVFAVGHNDHYIVAKQHPIQLSGEGVEEVDCTRTSYYILDIARNRRRARTGITGPLSAAQFRWQLQLKKLGSICFTLTYPDCP